MGESSAAGSREQVVLLDEDGNAAGVADKSTTHHANTPLHLAFSCYVFDRDGRFLLTRRASHKRTWPGIWTNTCCGHPAPQESMADAVARRLKSELGLTATEIELVLPRFRYSATMADGVRENEMCPVYRAEVDGAPQPDPDEVDGTTWVPWPEFAAAPGDVSPWCRWQVEQLNALGPDPWRWPVAPDAELPPACRP
ncbi:isopentenyl-diphosphate delta-isomerase [Haloactinopolyspora alba]|uniref:Isopentenyl-diphosphate Delta-isomerase n=1 Tax=Haloactinopolyspora alba TaxID=648780 RepID=A0A2P8DT81_9ACTN|nr:isopentenyl-diphosphate Delta-isomerase [Haloactinopolyspora alba]PSL00426.1 isopentenyl-diphosphate delta-isomerase [Haloactinopolyspora alba]